MRPRLGAVCLNSWKIGTSCNEQSKLRERTAVLDTFYRRCFLSDVSLGNRTSLASGDEGGPLLTAGWGPPSLQ